MVHFWEVTCDGCQNYGMVNFRYKCLRCEDYDLCAACYERGPTTFGHDQSHPFQCLMDRAMRELHFAGEPIPERYSDSFTCPICGEIGFSQDDLFDHIQGSHHNYGEAVLCPLCVAMPMSRPRRTTNICGHLTSIHVFRSDGSFVPGSFQNEGETTATVHALPSSQEPQVRFILPSGLRLAHAHLALPEDTDDIEVADM